MRFVDESDRFISILDCPFGRKGSYLLFKSTGADRFGKAYLYLATAHGMNTLTGKQKLFNVQPLYQGERIPYAIVIHTPTEMILRTLYGDIRICIAEEKLILFESTAGLGLRFASTPERLDRTSKPRGKNAWETQFQMLFSTVIHSITGSIEAAAPWHWDELRMGHTEIDLLPDENGVMYGSLEEFSHSGYVRENYPTYEEGLASVTADWETFKNNIPHLHDKYEILWERAVWNLWSYLRAPSGLIKRPYLFMHDSGPASQWQLSYQAVAFSRNIDLAWDQLMVPFDYQSPEGMVPDYYSDVYSAFSNVRPPIQGWALKQMKLRGTYDLISEDRLRDLYPRLAKWADWFMKYRSESADGLPNYEHSDESGMEDGSTFRESNCMVTPDLPTYLILLYEELGEMAEQLGLGEEVKAAWYKKAADMQTLLIEKLWNGECFEAHTMEGKSIEKDYCILGYVPVLLGKRLPAEILEKLIEDLKIEDYVLTPYGFCKEKVTARELNVVAGNDYRSMIYHPFNLLLISGLYDCGETDFASEVASRYCGSMADVNTLCQMMNAFDGPLRGGNFITWTSGAYLLIGGYIK